ncbi:MAG: signal peptidase I [Pseudomonadota bacterium]
MTTLFPLILVLLTALCLLIVIIDYCLLNRSRQQLGLKKPWWVDYSRSFLPVLIIVLIIRSFIFQINHVPTGSLFPTIVPGDYVLVEQYAYGLRLPVIHTKIAPVGEPQRGDIVVFRPPANPGGVNLIKRIIGLPGDHIVYKNRVLYINGKEATQKVLGSFHYPFTAYNDHPFVGEIREEDLLGIKHKIIINTGRSEDGQTVYDFVVPKGYYFAMGDNRDDSDDSRMWGFVPEANLVGKAYRVLFSWDSMTHRPRWSRIWHKLHD